MSAVPSPLPFLGLLLRTLRPALGWRAIPFLPRWAARIRADRKRFLGTSPDPGIEACKEALLPLAALHHELTTALGEERARPFSLEVASLVAVRLQRGWYLPALEARNWEAFHAEHARQMREGLIRHNEHTEPVVTGSRLEFQITRCRFHEAFVALGAPHLTEAFCRSDETVFNEYLPSMRFHRGSSGANTIARGGSACGFVFERKG